MVLDVQDHLLPEAYVTTMREHALDKCPVSSYEDVCRTFSEDLGALPEDLFATFEKEPIASASLAQVHRATTADGQHLAVKVQHAGLREHCDVDTSTIECVPPLNVLWVPADFYTDFTSLRSVRGPTHRNMPGTSG